MIKRATLYPSPSKCAKGFTLVELSIVIVIIGLIIAGVTAGQSLVKSARLRSAAFQFTQFETAYRIFQVQYTAIPGDMLNASLFWPGIQDGNGNRRLEHTSAAPSEHYYIWQHLSMAGLINGTYSGAGTAAAGINHPASDFGMFFAGYTGLFGSPGNNALGIARGYLPNGIACDWCGAALSPVDTKAIDTKADDGVANTGRLYAGDGDDVTAGSCSAKWNVVGGADYNLSNTTTACRLFYFFKDPRK